MSIILRQATSEDIPSIWAIIQVVVQRLNAENNFQWNETYPTENNFLEDLSAGYLWVAVDSQNQEVAGTAAYNFDQHAEYEDLGWDMSVKSLIPHRIAINPVYQGRGIAQLLLLKAEEVAKSSGCKVIRGDTHELNLPMRHIFEKLGYQYGGDVKLRNLPPIY
eukprot:gene25151-31302_t